MPDFALLILAAIAVLMLKHTLADFFLQTPYQYRNKGIYGHPGGLLHSLIHIALTPLVYLVLAPATFLLAGAIAAGEFLVHYHTDWLKERINSANGWTWETKGFWNTLGVDQLVHGLTYVAIVATLLWATG